MSVNTLLTFKYLPLQQTKNSIMYNELYTKIKNSLPAQLIEILPEKVDAKNRNIVEVILRNCTDGETLPDFLEVELPNGKATFPPVMLPSLILDRDRKAGKRSVKVEYHSQLQALMQELSHNPKLDLILFLLEKVYPTWKQLQAEAFAKHDYTSRYSYQGRIREDLNRYFYPRVADYSLIEDFIHEGDFILANKHLLKKPIGIAPKPKIVVAFAKEKKFYRDAVIKKLQEQKEYYEAGLEEAKKYYGDTPHSYHDLHTKAMGRVYSRFGNEAERYYLPYYETILKYF